MACRKERTLGRNVLLKAGYLQSGYKCIRRHGRIALETHLPRAQFGNTGILNLKTPPLLQKLINTGKWRHPGDEILLGVIPRLLEPVDFRERLPVRTVASEFQDSFLPRDWENFRLYRNDQAERALPWLNADRAILIAINRYPGDDVGIALDYRESDDAPTVVASFWRDDRQLEWFEIAKNFESFAVSLGFTNSR